MSEASPEVALPTTRTLVRTTLIAFVVAAVLVVGVVMPSEYGVDPTGMGRVLGLTQMGKLKMVLAKEEVELAQSKATTAQSPVSSFPSVAAAGGVHRDSMTVTLTPTQRVEVKLAMTKGQRASYQWKVDSGEVFFDLHGEGPAASGSPSQRYGMGSQRSAAGDIVAAFDGVHGWYWENQTTHDMQITVTAWGQFQALKKM